MRLRVLRASALAAGLALAVPALASAAPDPFDFYPAADYDQSSCTDGSIADPVQVVFRGFSSSGAAESTIRNDLALAGWDASVTPGGRKLKMADVPTDDWSTTNIHCEDEDSGLLFQTDQNHRTYLRLWSNAASGNVAGAISRQHYISSCGILHWVSNSGTGASGGLVSGRKELEQALQGQNATLPYGRYPFTEVYWGNSASIQQCDGSTIASDGWVADFQPKDSFGYKDGWPVHGDVTNPDLIGLARAQKVNTVSYGIPWRQIGYADNAASSCATLPPTPIGQTNNTAGNWDKYDKLYEKLTGYMPCQTGTSGQINNVSMIKVILGAGNPPGVDTADPGYPASGSYARWWCPEDGADNHGCSAGANGAGACTAIEEPDATTYPMFNTVSTPTVSGSATAMNAYRDFVHNLADRYGQWAKGIMVENEPNLDKWTGGCPPNPGRYAQLLESAHAGVVASPMHSDVPVVAGQTAAVGEGHSDNTDWQNFLNAAFNATVEDGYQPASLLDAVSIHPYRSVRDQNANQGFVTAANEDVDQARDLLARWPNWPSGSCQAPCTTPLVDEPLWVTEVGVTTEGTDSPNHVASEGIQATTLRNIYQALRVDKSVPVVQIYNFVDLVPGHRALTGYGELHDKEGGAGFLAYQEKADYDCLKKARGLAGACPDDGP